MTKVSLQKQTKDLTAQAEAIKRKIDEANSLVKSQVIWLQDAEKNLKLKIKEQKLIKKQEELKNEAEEKAKAQEVQNLKTQEEENHKASEKTKEEKKEKENKQKKTELKNKNETLKDKSKKTEIKKEKTKTKEEKTEQKPVVKTEQKPVVKTEKGAIEDKVIKHKKSVVPIKKESNNTQSNIDKKKSKTKIINIDDKPKRQIGIRVVKKAPTAEEIAAERKERQLKKQKIQQARKTTQTVKPGDRRTSVAHQARPQKSVQKKYEKRDTDTKQNTSLPKGDSKLPVRPNTRKKTRPVARNMYQQTPNTATRQKKKTPSSTRESGKKYVFGDVYSPTGSRRKGPRRNTNKKNIEKIVIENAVITTKTITIKELSEKIGKPGADIIKQLFLLGIMANINQSIDFDTAALVALELGITLEHNVEKTNEEKMVAAHDDLIDDENIIKRAPIVTVMGHVDHGKTSLLDAIRKTNVIQGEAGGITQHIGAYSINYKGEDITFIDTPGHEAFTAMRARGAQVTDIAVLVVAADDGVMPQTVEAINHAKAANVPIIVAINKMDVPGANPERVKQELTEHELLTEDWGGTTIMVELSALENEGIDKLLENIILVAEIQELKANPNASAKGTIIEAQLDTGRGPVATVLIQNGTLKIGDSIVAGTISGKVRAMIDDKGNKVEKAGPSSPVEVLGFSSVPAASDIMYAAGDKLSRKVAADRKSQIREDQTKSSQMVTLDDLFNKIKEGKLKDLNIVIKADVQGSVEAMKQSLIKLTNEEVRVTIKHSGVGAISESDVRLASASNAIIIGFNVRPDANGRAIAAEENVEIRTYRIIYNAIEDIEKAIKGMLKPIYTEAVQGHAEVRNVIKVTSIGNIAGSYITDGVFTRNSSARLLRDSVIIYEGKLLSLRRFKDDVKEVRQGFECGITLDNFNDIKEGDVIEAFIMKEVKR